MQARSPVTVSAIVGDAPLHGPAPTREGLPGARRRGQGHGRLQREPARAGRAAVQPRGSTRDRPGAADRGHRDRVPRAGGRLGRRDQAPRRVDVIDAPPQEGPCPLELAQHPQRAPDVVGGAHLAARDLPDALAVRVVPVPGRRAADLGLLLQAVGRVPVAAPAVRPEQAGGVVRETLGLPAAGVVEMVGRRVGVVRVDAVLRLQQAVADDIVLPRERAPRAVGRRQAVQVIVVERRRRRPPTMVLDGRDVADLVVSVGQPEHVVVAGLAAADVIGPVPWRRRSSCGRRRCPVV